MWRTRPLCTLLPALCRATLKASEGRREKTVCDTLMAGVADTMQWTIGAQLAACRVVSD